MQTVKKCCSFSRAESTKIGAIVIMDWIAYNENDYFTKNDQNDEAESCKRRDENSTSASIDV
jgi:hypothetical protein